MHPVLGREVVEAEQRFEVVAQLVGRLGPLGPELVIEGLGGVAGVLAVLSLADLAEHPLRERLDGLRQRIEDVRGLVHPAALFLGLGEDFA